MKVAPELLWRRVRHDPTRPLLQTRDPYVTLERLLGERTPVYAQADLTVRADARSNVAAVTRRVVAALQGAGALVAV